MNRECRRLRSDRRAATAVEFALICLPLVIFLLAVMGMGFQFYRQHSLDYAVQSAARQVQLGHIPAGYTAADFASKVLCPIFSAFENCTDMSVDVHPVADYQQLTKPGVPDAPDSTGTTGFQFCPGKPGQLMYVHVVYLAPSITGTLLDDTGVGSAMVANAAFANENPGGNTVVPANGC
jgi:Flp pilus assembly protein TadG